MQLQRIASSLAVVAALTFGASTLAQAQPHGGPRHHGPAPHAQGNHHGQHPGWQGGPRRATPPHMQHGHRPPHMQHGYRPPPPPMARHYRGAGPQHSWVMGSRVPQQYRGTRYVVNDWHGHRLHQPPRGHHWVRYGGDYMLVAIASGVITQLLINGMQ